MAERPDRNRPEPEPEPTEPEGAYLGEFRRGPAIFTVFRVGADPDRYRVLCSDGNGPSPVCAFTGEPGAEPRWHGAWNGDQWCPWIEAQARKIARRLPTRVRWRADRCRRSRPYSTSRCATAPALSPRTATPGPKRGPAGRSIKVETDRPAPPDTDDPEPPRAAGEQTRRRSVQGHSLQCSFYLDPDATGGFRIGA